MWAARDEDGTLVAYRVKPRRIKNKDLGPFAGVFEFGYNDSLKEYITLDKKELPQVTWSNSPLKLTLSITK